MGKNVNAVIDPAQEVSVLRGNNKLNLNPKMLLHFDRTIQRAHGNDRPWRYVSTRK